MHLDEEQVQRLLDRELSMQEEIRVREHLAGCSECRRRVADAEREGEQVRALLGVVDDPPPSVDVETIAARAQGRDLTWVRRAAIILLALGVGGAVYAAPGSPVKAWVDALAGRIGSHAKPPGSVPVPSQGSDQRVAGIAVNPGQRFVLLFTSSQSEGRARVSLAEGADVVVRAPLGAVTFTSGVDELLIRNEGSSASYEVQIPRAAAWVEIRVDGELRFTKAGSRIITGGRVDPSGTYIVTFEPSGR